MNKILICKDTLNKKLIEVSVLNESDSIKYEIIGSAPVIEERESEIGHYELNEQDEIVVVYDERPKSQLDLIQEQLNQLIQSTTTISEDNLLNMDLIMGTDEKVDLINTKLDDVKGE